jgi:PleD family two-component response regulator
MAEKETILIVEDDRFNIALMRELCESAGYEVVEAHDGDQAIEKAVKNPPDLVLLDIMMSGKDGFEVCLELRSREDTEDLPIIIVTALDDMDSKVQGIDLGADDYVTKPFRLFELQQRIRTAIDSRRWRRQLREAEEKLKKIGEFDAPGRVGGFRQLRTGLEYEFQRAQRYEHSLSCVLFSIDRYDDVLAKQGQKGIAALTGAVITVLQRTLRVVDRIYRMEKNEFILLLPETPAQGGRVAVERIRRSLLPPPKEKVEAITITAAVVTFPNPSIKISQDMLRVVNQVHQEAPEEGDCVMGLEEGQKDSI